MPLAHGALAISAPAHHQPLLAADLLDSFAIDRMALAPKHHVQAAIAEPLPLLGQRLQPNPQGAVVLPGSKRSKDRRPAPDTPAAPLSRRPIAGAPKPLDARRASLLLSRQILQRHVVQHPIRQQPLQLGILVLKRLQSPGF